MTAASIVLGFLAVPALFASGYLALLSLLSRRTSARPMRAPHLHFDIVVPAHDEASGIQGTVRSLLALDYPRELARVIVVADNCTDDTAERARHAGATVVVREDAARRGKGHALALAFEQILAERLVGDHEAHPLEGRKGQADAVVVVDADTVVSPNLLRVLAACLDAGASAVQADHAVRNPEASWRTRLMTIAFAMTHTLRSLARERLGVSCGLHGNGMCFTTALLRSVPYDAFSIVEDLEFSLRLGGAGHRVFYAADARVFSNMPTSESASRTQRNRWEGGRQQLFRLHAWRLFTRALRLRDGVALDLALSLLVPPLTMIVAWTFLGLGACAALSLRLGHVVGASWLWAACAAALFVYAVRGWQLSETGVQGLRAFAHVPRYIAWKLTLPFRRRTHARDEWVRTAREEERS